MKKNWIFYLFMVMCLSLHGAQTIGVQELDLSRIWQEYGDPEKGRTVAGKEFLLGEEVCSEILGLHAKSILKINLHGKAKCFTAQVGVLPPEVEGNESELIAQPLSDGSKLLFAGESDKKQFKGLVGKDNRVSEGSVIVMLKTDGEELYNSGLIRPNSGLQTIDVNLENKKWLEILIDSAGDGASGDSVVLVKPQLIYDGEKPEMADVGAIIEGPEQSLETVKRLQEKIALLPVFEGLLSDKTEFDWLIYPEKSKAEIYRTEDGKGIIIANPMVSRTFRIFPNLATVDLSNRMLGESMLRAVSPEGYIWIDGKRYTLGGLAGQPELAYLKNEWLDGLKTIPESFLVEDFEIKPIEERIHWARSRWALNKEAPTGKEIIFTLRGERGMNHVAVKLHFAIYDTIPVIQKWFELENQSSFPLNVDRFYLEYLSFAEPESPSGGDPDTFLLPSIHIESDYNCAGSFTEKETDITEKWVEDPHYTSQRNYLLQTRCILQVAPPLGPDQEVEAGGIFKSFSVYEMPFDSDERERKGLFTRHFYRTIAPWTTENPIFLHLTSSNPEAVRRAVDQCAETGYEMIILSFGSGANAEDISEQNIARWKEMVDYAESKGIEMGCYSLLASRWISEEVDVINPKTGKRGGARFGSSPCLSSEWGADYFKKIKTFFQKTGMRCFEHDGSYPGDVCASTHHAYHKGLNDSQWNQFYKITELYHWMCENGIYLNVPDFYFLNGSTKVSIGYRETNWSLPRERQLIHTRQLNYDCTFERPSSALWSFVPLVQYHGGGSAATLEPLSEHLYEYRTLMFQNYGAGVQACYRGPRLYDTPETKAVVVEVIDWYKKYRRILNSDIIHLRKPDARDWDGIMHVDPKGKEKAMILLFNPLDQDIVRTIDVPLYYTGLTQNAKIREQESEGQVYTLDREYQVKLTVKLPANGYSWYVVE